MGRVIGIVLVVALLAFGGYKILGGRVDRTNADAVGAAFLKALKKEDLSRAKKYILPDQADAWEANAKGKLSNMRTNAMGMFRDAIPDEPTFTDAPAVKGSTDKAMKAGETIITMRQQDGDWYVTSCSQP